MERTLQRSQPVVDVAFAAADCQACPMRPRCTYGRGPRHLMLQAQAEHQALQAARQRQTTEAFKEHYAARAGVEGTLSQAVRACGFRSTRYIGLAKTHLQHILTATAINLVRLAEWFDEPAHHAPRPSPFATVMATAP